MAGVGIAGHFALVGGADHVTGRVGKAAAVGSVLDRLGLDPTRDAVIMVGDCHHDVDGAAHGVPTVGVAWGYAGPRELDQARTAVADMDELASSTGRARGGRRARTRRGAGSLGAPAAEELRREPGVTR